MSGIRGVSKTSDLKHHAKYENCWQDVDSNKALYIFQRIMVLQNTMITENINIISTKPDSHWDHVEDWLCDTHESYKYNYISINYRDGT